MSGDGVVGALAGLRAAVDMLLDADFEALDRDDFPDVIEAFERERRRLDAVDVRLLAATDAAHVAARHCRSSLADLLTHRLHLSPGEARARVRRARDLAPRRTLLGEPLDPTHPTLAAAQAAGEISTQQLDAATRILGRIPTAIALEATGPAETLMVDAARHQTPAGMTRTGTMLLERLDPDGDERTHHRRDLHLHRHPDGSWTLRGTLTDDTGLALRTVLDPLATPCPADNGTGTGTGTGGSGDTDARTAAQRDHDALRDLCTRVLRAGTLPDTGGTPVTILARVDADDLTHPDGTANPKAVMQTEHGHLTRLRALIHLAGDAELVPAPFDRTHSERQLVLGRTRRLANRAQRRALTARDGGCCFPGGDRPASWTEVHHIREWALGGRTDLDNLCLLCGFHHREFDRRGWQVTMKAGRPHWLPPYWLDPHQRPRLNTTHHLPEITFTPNGNITAALRL